MALLKVSVVLTIEQHVEVEVPGYDAGKGLDDEATAAALAAVPDTLQKSEAWKGDRDQFEVVKILRESDSPVLPKVQAPSEPYMWGDED